MDRKRPDLKSYFTFRWGQERRRSIHSMVVHFGHTDRCIDDPMVTPKEKYRYEVCITIPEKFTIDAGNYMETNILPKCKYAVARVFGNFSLVAAATHYLFNNWLINSSFEPDHQPGLEIFLDKENICNWNHFDLGIVNK